MSSWQEISTAMKGLSSIVLDDGTTVGIEFSLCCDLATMGKLFHELGAPMSKVFMFNKYVCASLLTVLDRRTSKLHRACVAQS